MKFVKIGDTLQLRVDEIEALQFIEFNLTKVYTHHNTYEVPMSINLLRSLIDMTEEVDERVNEVYEEEPKKFYDITNQFVA